MKCKPIYHQNLDKVEEKLVIVFQLLKTDQDFHIQNRSKEIKRLENLRMINLKRFKKSKKNENKPKRKTHYQYQVSSVYYDVVI